MPRRLDLSRRSSYTAIAALAPDDVDVGTATGDILHWDGTSWTTEPLPLRLGGGAAVTALSETRTDDRFAMTQGTIFQYDGARWSALHIGAGGWVGLLATQALVTVWDGVGTIATLVRIRPWVCAPSETACANGVDDDCDGLIDSLDPDCP